MKNIHILPTDKPSRLKQNKITKKISLVNKGIDLTSYTPINIYITNDEEIKVGDWVIEFQKGDNIGEVHFINGEYVIANDIQKKIILTTDQDLINDGVQSIDDDFLHWFVKNPSCKEVEVGYGWIRLTETDNEGYWVSIPNKQFEMQQEESKQKTLDEVAEALFPNSYIQKCIFIKGAKSDEARDYWYAKWQQEQDKNKYSKEDLREEFKQLKLTAVEWLYLQSRDKQLDLFDLLEAKAMENKHIKKVTMSPKEKAEELVVKFLKFTSKHERLETAGLGAITLAKQCALITVDEVMKEYGTYFKVNVDGKYESYWQEVKQQIEKL